MAHELILSLGTNNGNIIVLTKSRYMSRVLFQGKVQTLSMRRSDEICLSAGFGEQSRQVQSFLSNSFFTILHLYASDASVSPVSACFFQDLLLCDTLQTPNVESFNTKLWQYLYAKHSYPLWRASFELTFPKVSQGPQLEENNLESKKRKDLFLLHLPAQSFLTSDSIPYTVFESCATQDLSQLSNTLLAQNQLTQTCPPIYVWMSSKASKK